MASSTRDPGELEPLAAATADARRQRVNTTDPDSRPSVRPV
jgi:hypothetical protein